MKFTEKYEILELLSSGRVSTFLVRDRATRDQFVVHSFDCPRVPSGEPQQPAVFKHFASLAPSPAGRILEVGFDEASASAYVAAAVPPTAALRDWIRSYHAFEDGKGTNARVVDETATAELSATEVNAILGANRPPETPRPSDPKPTHPTQTFPIGQPASSQVQTKGEFTRLFEDLGAFQRFTDTGSQKKADAEAPKNSIPKRTFEIPSSATKATPSPLKSASDSRPGSFTEEFLLGKREEGKKDTAGTAAPGIVPSSTPDSTLAPGPFTREFLAITGKGQPAAGTISTAKEPPPRAAEPASSFTELFDSPASSSKGPATKLDWNAPEAAKGNNTGEFTSFFGGPFNQPDAGKKFDKIPDLSAPTPARAPTGDFTRVFGHETLETSQVREPEPLPEQTPGSFTQIFGKDSERSAQLGTSRLDTDPGLSPSPPSQKPPVPAASASMPAEKDSLIFSPFSTSSPSPKAMNTPSGRDSTLLYRSNPTDATDVFRTPGGADAPAVEAPSGPSEFTQFLSRRQVEAALPPEQAVVPPPPSGAAPSPFAFPPAPPVPPPPAPAALAPPPMPAMPKLAAPPMPQPPAAPATSALASYWPLITVLTVLIAIGAMMVMYFVLKH
jgi:hypothetical protein